jgi:CRP/FNR family transcriptional regulator, cyclic AMP receptor protein
MIERFQGETGRPHVIEAFKAQKIVAGDHALAERIAEVGTLMEVGSGTAIIEQGAEDNDVFLIIAGAFEVLVNGRRVSRRFSNDHIGEMAAIQPTQRRSATCISSEKSVVCRLSEPHLTELGREFPNIWRYIAKELARRLEQRNAHVTATHDKINVFIISSVEALEIARTIQNALAHDFTIVLWTDGVFRASWYPIESLERQLDQSDFAVAVVQPDDMTSIRGTEFATPRDNVIFELGMFIGRLGRQRSFLIEPRGTEVKLPSDLAGITTVPYRHDPLNLAASMGPTCNRVREIMRDLGPNN